MTAIDQVKAHFSRLAVRTIEVPEWAGPDGAPMIIYATPMTLSEKAKLYDIGERFGNADKTAHTLILKSQDAQGAKLFTLEDKHALMHQAESSVVMRIALELNAAATVEQAEKN